MSVCYLLKSVAYIEDTSQMNEYKNQSIDVITNEP